VGLFSKALKIADYNQTTGFSAPTQLTNIFDPSTLARAVIADVDSSAFPVNESEALTVPAVAAGLGILTSVGSRLPLIAAAADGSSLDLPFLNKTEGVITPQKRASSIQGDLFLYNHALIAVARNDEGYVIAFEHIPVNHWSLNQAGEILIDNKPVPKDKVIYIPGLARAGFLDCARDSIRQYRNITQTINNRSAAPEPVTIISETQDSRATQEEIDEVLDNLYAAMQARGGFVVEPFGLNIRGYGGSDSANQMMVEAREALRKDIANFMGISVSLLDGAGGDSQVYQNAVDERNELLELSLKRLTEPLADRLSQDDCTPPGIKISVDYSSFRTNVSGKANQESVVTPDV
jgi:hypothetical protein